LHCLPPLIGNKKTLFIFFSIPLTFKPHNG
jgi:hypothetical protein